MYAPHKVAIIKFANGLEYYPGTQIEQGGFSKGTIPQAYDPDA